MKKEPIERFLVLANKTLNQSNHKKNILVSCFFGVFYSFSFSTVHSFFLSFFFFEYFYFISKWLLPWQKDNEK